MLSTMSAPDDTPNISGEPIRLITRVEYERMAELGFFDNENVELLFGVVVPKPPIDQAHVISVRRIMTEMVLALGRRADIDVQAPFAASDASEPQPDIIVTTKTAGWPKEHPSRALLVIEVARSSLRRDRTLKSKLYGLAAVDEYWIVNHVDSVIEVYRDRQTDGSWRTCSVAQRGEHVSPLAFPDVALAVDDVVPPSES